MPVVEWRGERSEFDRTHYHTKIPIAEISHTLQTALFSGTSYTGHLIYGKNGITERKKILWPGEEE